MPLTPDEAVRLSPKAAALATALRSALDPLGEEGRRVTRAELGAVVRAALALVSAVVVDVLD